MKLWKSALVKPSFAPLQAWQSIHYGKEVNYKRDTVQRRSNIIDEKIINLFIYIVVHTEDGESRVKIPFYEDKTR